MAGGVTIRRSRAVGNVGGIRGLAVQFTGAEETKRALALLPGVVQRRLLRYATAAAARPIVAYVKQYANAYSRTSRRGEAIGTVGRSITSKVATSKKNPAVAYALIGARRGYGEFVTFHSDTDRRAGVAHVSIQTRKVLSRRNGRIYSKVTSRDLKNIGPIARKARLDPKSNSTRKRIPSRYLHLIEKGGTARKIRAGNMLSNAADNAAGAAQDAYTRVMLQGMIREFDKMAAK